MCRAWLETLLLFVFCFKPQADLRLSLFFYR